MARSSGARAGSGANGGGQARLVGDGDMVHATPYFDASIVLSDSLVGQMVTGSAEMSVDAPVTQARGGTFTNKTSKLVARFRWMVVTPDMAVLHATYREQFDLWNARWSDVNIGVLFITGLWLMVVGYTWFKLMFG